MDNIDELFKKDSIFPKGIKYIIYLIKKIFCILTIKNDNICILPYKKVNSKILINIIIKIVSKITNKVVLSKYLNELYMLKVKLEKSGIYVYTGEILTNYLVYNFVDYISQQIGEEVYTQEIYVLVNNLTKLNEDNIVYFSENFKRVNLVTKNITRFKKIEERLEKRGIAITITNNKRRSLIKAKIIVNLDFDEDMINSYNVNQTAIFIQVNSKTVVKSKLFNGINILDYQIVFDDEEMYLNNIEYNKFDKKLLYESLIYEKNYEEVIERIKRDNVRIVNLIGKNGIINKEEYKNLELSIDKRI